MAALDDLPLVVGVGTRRWPAVLGGFVVLGAATGYLFRIVPAGFLPDEDQGYIIVSVQGPEGASLERTRAVTDRVYTILRDIPGVDTVLVIGASTASTGRPRPISRRASRWFKPWEERRAPQLRLGSILARARRELAAISEAGVVAFNPPPIRGLSVTGGFQFQVQAFGAEDLGTLQGLTQEIIRRGSQRPELVGLFSTFRANTPLFYLDIDRTKAKSLGVGISDVASTLQIYLGSLNVNDFNKYGRVFRVVVQADGLSRTRAADVGRLGAGPRERRAGPGAWPASP